MPRTLRVDHAGEVYHVMNRSVGKVQIFSTPDDYLLFVRFLREAVLSYKLDVLAYSVMPNHWHLLLRPREDGEMGKFMQWLTTSHTCKVRHITNTVGYGPIYKGRYKSFIVDSHNYLIRVIAYIERNAVRAGLVKSPCDWRWCSAWMRKNSNVSQGSFLNDIPDELAHYYNEVIGEEESDDDLTMLRNSVAKGVPLGDKEWAKKMMI